MHQEQPTGSTRFFRWIDGKHPPIRESLEQLSGQESEDDHRTSLIERANMAWATPVHWLSCEQVRLLTGQKMGLEWLAAPVAIFVSSYPGAFVTFYEGDLTLSALKAFPELMEFAPTEARAMLEADFSLIAPELAKADDRFAREVQQAIADARILARGHS